MAIGLVKPKFDLIWPQFLFSADFSRFDEKITDECYNIKKQFPESAHRTNAGGWQSKVFNDSGSDSILELKNTLIEVCNKTVTEITDIKFQVKKADWWVNINSENSFNVPHHHGPTKIVGVYYPQVPKSPGTLTLYRPDRNDHLRAYERTCIDIVPEKGRVYLFPGHIMHAVLPNGSWEVDRVSVAFSFV